MYSPNILIETIQRLLQIKKSCTISEIANTCGKKKMDVLKEITDNKKLLRFDTRGAITGLVNTNQPQIDKMINIGMVYTTSLISYGAEAVINWNHPEAEKLKQDHYEGFYGDCRKIRVILDTPENRKAVEAHGAKHVNNITVADLEPLERYWKPLTAKQS